jgi:nucleoid-associated protein YgaU
VVKEGDSLWKLAMEIYGVGNNNVIKWVKEHNPHIRDVHTINIGETILFPALPE